MKSNNANALQALKEFGNAVGIVHPNLKEADGQVLPTQEKNKLPDVPEIAAKPKPSSSFLSDEVLIEGNITSAGDFELRGVIQGNIESNGCITVTGKVVGNMKAKHNVTLLGASVQGDIDVAGTIFVDHNTVIIGNVCAKNIDLDGHMKGSVQVEEVANLKSNAILVGNVQADKTIMNEGALMNGSIIVCEGRIESNLFEGVVL